MNSDSPDIFTYDQGAYDWPQWHDSTLEYDTTMDHYSDWLSDDFLPVVEDHQKSPNINSISEHRSSILNVGSAATLPLPSWTNIETDIQSSRSPPRSANYTYSLPASPHQQACHVCNDVASGMHFGVMSCEACKSFFRRSIRSGAKYVCRANKCCDIDKNTRNKCQHCRLQKCINVGMKRNGKEVLNCTQHGKEGSRIKAI